MYTLVLSLLQFPSIKASEWGVNTADLPTLTATVAANEQSGVVATLAQAQVQRRQRIHGGTSSTGSNRRGGTSNNGRGRNSKK